MACFACAAILVRRCSAGTRSGLRTPARCHPARANNESTYGGDEMARLPSITSKDQVAAKDRDTFDSIVASRGAVQGPFTMFLHSPEIADRVAHLGAYVRFEGSLDMRVRVLAAMVVAREYEAMYVWGAQSGGARRLGVPESTITAIRENHSRGIPAEDAQIVEFTRTLLRRHRIDDATADAMRQRFRSEERRVGKECRSRWMA